ncbi:MAG: ABC transporter permease [Planctomycetota bacterium]
MNLLRLGWAYFTHRLILPVAAIGITLGVAVLFTVLAVFQGFLEEFENSIRDFSGDVVVDIPRLVQTSEQTYRDWLLEVDGVEAVTPRLNWFGLIGRRGSRSIGDPRSADLNGILMMGVDEEELRIAPSSRDKHLSMVLGEPLADRLGLKIGDAIEIVTHRAGGGNPVPVRQSFELVGHFATGRFDLEMDRVFVRRDDLAALSKTSPSFTTWRVDAAEGVEADALKAALQEKFRTVDIDPFEEPRVSTWRDLGGNFLRAAENQKGMLGIVFGFIVLVAAYQLIATLLLTVTEKRRDIGILGALGASPARIIGFFVGLGLLISTIGCILGLALGWVLAHNLQYVERLLGGGEQIFLPEVYKFDHIPVAVDLPAVLVLLAATLATAVIFSLLPAWRASRLRIIQSLQRPR